LNIWYNFYNTKFDILFCKEWITIKKKGILIGLTSVILILSIGVISAVSIKIKNKAESQKLLAINQQKKIAEENKIKEANKKVEEEAVQNAVIVYKLGDKGNGVLKLQKKLYDIGYDILADGSYGQTTGSIIKDYQAKNNLTASGNYDKGTETSLNSKKDTRNYDTDHAEKIAGQQTDNESLPLEERIRNYMGNGISRVGFIYYDLTTGEKITINGNKLCTAASTYKVGMNMVAYNWVRNGKLSLSEGLSYSSKYYEAGTGILQGQINTTLKKPVNVQKLLDYSIIYSDNIATKMLQARLGGGQAVRKAVCDMTGITIDTVNNKITPEIEFKLLKELYGNRYDQYNSHLISDMKQTIFHDRIDKYVPKSLVAHKIGNYSTYVNDVGIVFTDKPYIFIMYVDGLSNSAEKIANISKMVYQVQLEK